MPIDRTDAVKILLVDDEADFRGTLSKILSHRGMQVTTAGSGEEALACLACEEPEVIVLDLKMPGLDGIATLQRILLEHPSCPVIMLTGHGTVTAALDAIRHRVFDFLLKPVTTEHLIGIIEAAVSERRRRTGTAE
jgi:DNA-binding NtrC family response regulator